MPNPQNRNDRRKGEDRSETLIIPHITKEMLETARRMAQQMQSSIDALQAQLQTLNDQIDEAAAYMNELQGMIDEQKAQLRMTTNYTDWPDA